MLSQAKTTKKHLHYSQQTTPTETQRWRHTVTIDPYNMAMEKRAVTDSLVTWDMSTHSNYRPIQHGCGEKRRHRPLADFPNRMTDGGLQDGCSQGVLVHDLRLQNHLDTLHATRAQHLYYTQHKQGEVLATTNPNMHFTPWRKNTQTHKTLVKKQEAHKKKKKELLFFLL